MKQTESTIQSSLPLDIALKIALSLEVSDVCKLGCCSRFWRELCGSDCLWESLATQRWPSIPSLENSSKNTINKDWREVYIKIHKDRESKATDVIEYVKHCSLSQSLEAGEYSKAVEYLNSMQF